MEITYWIFVSPVGDGSKSNRHTHTSGKKVCNLLKSIDQFYRLKILS